MAFTIAGEMAEYLYKQDESRRKIVTFQTDIQGLIPQFLDKIMVSHNALQWGEAGEVISVSGSDIVLSAPIEDIDSVKTIVFRNIDGSVSDACSISLKSIVSNITYPSSTLYPEATISTNEVTVTSIPVWVASGIFYTIQDTGTSKEFLVVSVKPSDDTVTIECVNYDSSIY